jgi:hypothetical protein
MPIDFLKLQLRSLVKVIRIEFSRCQQDCAPAIAVIERLSQSNLFGGKKAQLRKNNIRLKSLSRQRVCDITQMFNVGTRTAVRKASMSPDPIAQPIRNGR